MKELIAIVSFFLIHVNAQELNCQVQVIAPTLQSNPANQEIIGLCNHRFLNLLIIQNGQLIILKWKAHRM